MKRTNTIIIGAGQAGLAMSRSLADLAIDHVLFERGRVAERWRSERWDSLRLLTPNWMSRLPGWRYRGADPNGFMTVGELVDYLRDYARSSSAPVEEQTAVRSVRPTDDGYLVDTTRGVWRASNVVIATGHNAVPLEPAFARDLSPEIFQLVPSRYRNPSSLPDGGVLVVGASATGIQLADEIHRSGRPVTLSVGSHVRLPRSYRGADIMEWLEMSGVLYRRPRGPSDARQPSLQLVGTPEHRNIDLDLLQRDGVRLVGRARGAEGWRVGFHEDLAATTAAADDRLERMLARIDSFAAQHAGAVELPDPDRPARVRPAPAPELVDLRAEGISSVLWATGFRRSYPWLKVPVLDGSGEIRHRGGVTPAPGLYVLGLQYMRRAKSSFIDGVGDDARALSFHIASRTRGEQLAAA